MSGRHKWSELNRNLSPESRQRIAEVEAETDATLPPDEPCAVVPMRMLRELEDTPMSELEIALQTDEAGVLTFEECDDPRVSQLRSYATAMGARLKIVIDFPDYEVILADFYQRRRWPAPPIKKPAARISGYRRYEIPEPPTTYAQIQWAAKAYNQHKDGPRYNAAYGKVNTSEFRESLIRYCSNYEIERLLEFLNRWDSRRSYKDTAPVLLESVPDAISTLRHLTTELPDNGGLDDWDATLVMRAIDRLMADKGVSATIASKILAVVNPELFPPWDNSIQQAYFPGTRPGTPGAGARYASFINNMTVAAMSIRKDALAHLGIADPADHLSKTLGHHPAYTLAKFIDEYNFLIISKGETYPGTLATQEHHA
jgi:hypothetical protein